MWLEGTRTNKIDYSKLHALSPNDKSTKSIIIWNANSVQLNKAH